MHLPRIIRRNRSAGRRLVAGVVLTAILLGITGAPLPTWAEKDLSVAFPCMHRQCGCRNAAACWNSCCCHTNAEKLAWAKERGIEPPKFAVAGAQREAASVRGGGACCSAKASLPVNCCAKDAPAPASQSRAAEQHCGERLCGERLCGEKRGAEKATAGNDQVEADPATADWVRLVDARRCFGQAELWLMLGQIAPIESEFSLDCRPLPQGWVTLGSNNGEILLSCPDRRPPRTTV